MFEDNSSQQLYVAPVATLFSSEETATTTPQLDGSNHQSQKFHVPDAMSILSPPQNSTTNFDYKTTTNVDPKAFTSSSAVYLSATEAETVNSILSQNMPTEQRFDEAINLPVASNLVRPSSKSLLGSLMNIPASPSQHYAVTCSHENAGQELCYLCHQRQKRNVPIYYHEENKRKEKEESQILSQYQHLKVRY